MPKTKPKTKTTATTKKKEAAAAPKKVTKAIPKKAAPKKTAPIKAATKKTAPKKTTAAKPVKEKKQVSKTAATPAKAPNKTANAAPKPKTSAPTTTKKTATATKGGKMSFKNEISQKLLTEKKKILQEVSLKIKSESNVLKFEIGDIYDIASKERDRELTLMLGDRDREKLSQIEDALERMKDNIYGECEECGEPIAENRLRALPSTRVCVECQSKHEREVKIKGGRFEEDSGLGIMERGEAEDEEF